MKKFINLLVIAMLLLVSCDKDSAIPEEQLSEKEVNGDDVFKTVFFYLGDEAKAISSYEKQVALLEKSQLKSDEFLKYYEASARAYLSKVEEKNPKFTDDLKNAVLSKDFEQIKASLIYGGNLMMAIATIDALETTKDKKVAGEFGKLNLGNYDFTTTKGLSILIKDLDGIMKDGGYDFEAIQSSDSHDFGKGRILNLNFAINQNINFSQNFNFNQNLNLNQNFTQNFNFNRVFNFVRSYDFNYNWNFAQVQNLIRVQAQAFNIITPLETGAKYDNYSGEKLIEDIAFAF